MFDVIGYNYKEHLYSDDHARFPDQPLLGSENGHGYAEWRAAEDNAYVAGQFLWTGIDYLGEAHGWPIHGSGAGLLTLAGFEKPTFFLRQSWWTDAPLAMLATRPATTDAETSFWSHPVGRDWGETGGGPVEVLCFATNVPVLSCGGAVIPLQWDERNGYWATTMAPAATPLVLETWRDGAVVARDILTRRGPATSMEAKAWQAPPEIILACTAAGLSVASIAQVEVTLRDADGQHACDERPISAVVEKGRLLGLENGDLADTTPYTSPTRTTLDGRLVVYVVRGPGTRLHLCGPGLAPAVVTCEPLP